MTIDVVAAIIFYNNKVLAAQRAFSLDKDISLKFEFPGGKINKSETKINALKRELQEELSGLNMRNVYVDHSAAPPSTAQRTRHSRTTRETVRRALVGPSLGYVCRCNVVFTIRLLFLRGFIKF